MMRGEIPVDILEIMSLVWEHPVAAGMLLLMFTPPFFPVVVFFSPLLISTALCAVALISVGHSFEDVRAKREREIAGWNARVIERDRLSARERVYRRRPGRVGGEDRWLDWVKGLEPGTLWSTESALMDDLKEEGLKSDFRPDEGGINMFEDEFIRQIEALNEYEKKAKQLEFSAKQLPVTSALKDTSISVEAKGVLADDSTNDQLPSLLLYHLRTGGLGNGSPKVEPPQASGKTTSAPKLEEISNTQGLVEETVDSIRPGGRDASEEPRNNLRRSSTFSHSWPPHFDGMPLVKTGNSAQRTAEAPTQHTRANMRRSSTWSLSNVPDFTSKSSSFKTGITAETINEHSSQNDFQEQSGDLRHSRSYTISHSRVPNFPGMPLFDGASVVDRSAAVGGRNSSEEQRPEARRSISFPAPHIAQERDYVSPDLHFIKLQQQRGCKDVFCNICVPLKSISR